MTVASDLKLITRAGTAVGKGDNVNGGIYTLAAGASTGEGTSGIEFHVSKGDSSGAADATVAAEKVGEFNGAGNFVTTGDIIVGGGLTVNGTTTTVSTTNMVVQDNLIELNTGAGSNTNDCGIIMERGSTGDNAFMGWDESADKFIVATTTNVATDTGNLTLTDAAFQCGAITSSGNLAVTGTLTGDTSLTLDSTTITTAEIGVLDAVTPGTAAASKALVLDANKDVGTIRNLTINGTFSDGNYTFDTSGNVSGLGTVGCGAITSSGNLAVTGTLTGDTSLTLDSTTITTAEIGVLDSVTPGTAAASKALVLDSNKDVATIRNLTIDGTFSDGNYTFDTSGNVSGLGTVGCGAITSSGNLAVTGTLTGDTSLTLDTTTITTAEIGVLDSVTPGTAAASKAVVLDGNRDIATVRNVTSDGTVQFGSLSDGSISIDGFKDEDNMASDSDTHVPTQQSVKAFANINNSNSKYTGTNFTNSISLGTPTFSNLDGDAIQNTFVGITVAAALTQGDENVAVGYGAASSITTGSQNTVVGSTGNVSAAANNQTAIGYGATCTAANEIVLGNSSVSALRCGASTIAELSDERDKTDVVDLPWGLDFVDTLRPVQFTWDRRVLTPEDVNHPRNGQKRAGFLAQDFQRAMPNGENEILDLVYEVNPERIEAKYGALIPMLTQAIKDLKAQNDALMARVESLENRN